MELSNGWQLIDAAADHQHLAHLCAGDHAVDMAGQMILALQAAGGDVGNRLEALPEPLDHRERVFDVGSRKERHIHGRAGRQMLREGETLAADAGVHRSIALNGPTDQLRIMCHTKTLRAVG